MGSVKVRCKEGKGMEWPSRTSLFSEVEGRGMNPAHMLSLREEGALRREMGLLSALLSWSLRYVVPQTL